MVIARRLRRFIAGHAHPAIVEAVSDRSSRHTAQPTEDAIWIAASCPSLRPSAVAFANSGTEVPWTRSTLPAP
jgi:glutamate-1-semialdehyde 2,1-aminomutase